MAERATLALQAQALRQILASQAWLKRHRPFTYKELAEVHEIRRLPRRLAAAVGSEDARQIRALSGQVDRTLLNFTNERLRRRLE